MEETVERPDRFRKVKDLVQNVKTNATVKTVQSHFEENKKVYLVGAIGVIAYVSKSRPIQIVNAPVFEPVFKPVFKPVLNNIINNTVNNTSNPGFAVRCIETGQEWARQIQCATDQDIDPGLLSKCIHNKIPHVNDLHYERIAKIVS